FLNIRNRNICDTQESKISKSTEMRHTGGSIVFVLVVCVFTGVASQCECDNVGSDPTICEWSCTYYIYCDNGTQIREDCEVGDVVNIDNGECDIIDNVPPPCGVRRNCTGKADGYYANLDDACLSYHYCIGGEFQTNNLCPDGLIFDEPRQLCNWPNNVCPECGTGTGDPLYPCEGEITTVVGNDV
ncbi:unnamed protein product, partial [Owenia fusiformis]